MAAVKKVDGGLSVVEKKRKPVPELTPERRLKRFAVRLFVLLSIGWGVVSTVGAVKTYQQLEQRERKEERARRRARKEAKRAARAVD